MRKHSSHSVQKTFVTKRLFFETHYVTHPYKTGNNKIKNTQTVSITIWKEQTKKKDKN